MSSSVASQGDRARGALLGLAVGDALGTTLEFSTPHVPGFPARLTGPHVRVTGGGPFRLAAGEVTDDTQMACCLAASLRARAGFEAADVVGRYVVWHRLAFDVGTQTRSALGIAALEPTAGGRVVWERATGQKPAGNGSLMRAAPLGVHFADANERIEASMADSSLTHYDPRCVLACVAFNGAVAAGLRGVAVDEMLVSASADLDVAAALLGDRTPSMRATIGEGLRDISEDLRMAEASDPKVDGVNRGTDLDLLMQAGFVRVALRVSFWELVHAPSFESALVDVVNRGGDADTNGAITGALLGAHHGETAIPADWRAAVLGAEGLRPEYHPRVLLGLADARSSVASTAR